MTNLIFFFLSEKCFLRPPASGTLQFPKQPAWTSSHMSLVEHVSKPPSLVVLKLTGSEEDPVEPSRLNWGATTAVTHTGRPEDSDALWLSKKFAWLFFFGFFCNGDRRPPAVPRSRPRPNIISSLFADAYVNQNPNSFRNRFMWPREPVSSSYKYTDK